MNRRQAPSARQEPFTAVNPNAAGLDIGSAEIWACVPADRDPQPVCVFGTFTPDLHALADWLEACGIETVAMESTRVYWIPVYELLEARGFNDVSGKCAASQECARAQDRCARPPMDSTTA
jgi:hypothetical protein